MTAPIGAVVAIAYASDDDVRVGDVLRTRTGRAYLVIDAVRARARWRLRCVVVDNVQPGARVLPLVWDRRRRND